MAVIVDTGILYALADVDDDWHERSRTWLERQRDLLIVPVTVLPEVTYLLHTRLGSAIELAFVESVAAGELEIEGLRQPDLDRCRALMKRYPEVGFVDASIVAVAGTSARSCRSMPHVSSCCLDGDRKCQGCHGAKVPGCHLAPWHPVTAG
jgi:predicted nucleic acid-binding protein